MAKCSQNIFSDSELEESSVCRKFRRNGAYDKEYNTKFYNLETVIAVGFRTNESDFDRLLKETEKAIKGVSKWGTKKRTSLYVS
jgi:hypothetical protein